MADTFSQDVNVLDRQQKEFIQGSWLTLFVDQLANHGNPNVMAAFSRSEGVSVSKSGSRQTRAANDAEFFHFITDHAIADAANVSANKPYPSRAQEAKDKFIWENICQMSRNELILEINKRKTSRGWRPTEGHAGFRKAASRYSMHYGLETRNFAGEKQ